jgi:FkbH-like protein
MTVDPNTRKAEIERLIAAGEPRRALNALGAFWRENMRPSAASYILNQFEKIRDAVPMRSCQLAILRSFTVEPVAHLLRASAAVAGIDLILHVGGFNAYAQEMLDPESEFYRFAPDVAILAVQSRDIAPDLWADFADLNAEQVVSAVARVSDEIRNCVEAFRSRSNCHLVIHTLEATLRAANGIMDGQREDGQTAAFRKINKRIAMLPREYPGVYVLDYEALIAEMGQAHWHSEQNWASSRLPLSADALPRLAAEWLRFLHPITGKSCKALAVDLDNTLWGGVVGEDGSNGIRLGAEFPGVAYVNLQRAILDLYQRGILLAICSKNDPADAMEVLEKHPAMLLRPEHFAAIRINWNDKAENLRSIAGELNIGIDAIAFLDDNPAEREWVRNQEPDVTVIDLPDDAVEYAPTLRDAAVFERLTVSAEDRERNRYYSEQRQREGSKREGSSVEDFYRSLSTVVQIAPATPATMPRIAQLTQKTNQFNLTTKRYSEQEITAMAAKPGWSVYTVAVRDRFGDNGITGVAITREFSSTCEIDTFLLSCRVIGRTVETAVLAYLAEKAKHGGAVTLAGELILTKKNAPARDFYRAHGFCCVTESGASSRWELDLAGGTQILTPPWLEVKIVQETYS